MATNDFSLAGIMQSATSVFSEMQTSIAEIKNLSAQGTKVADAMANALANGTDANGDTALSVQARLEGELQAQNNKAEFWQAIGQDGAGQAKLSNQLATAFKENTQRALEQAQSIRERESVGLLDNPLAFLFNQIVLPDEKNALDATLQEGAIIKNSMNQLNQALQQTAKSELDYAVTRNKGSIDSQVAGMKANLEAKALKARMDAIQYNSHNLETVMRANQSQIDFQAKVAQIRNSEEHMQLAREAAGRERVKFNKWLADEADTDKAIAEVTRYANATAKSMGRPEFTPKQVEMAMKGKSGIPGLVDQIKSMAQVGYVNENSGAIGARYGESFTTAVDFARNVKVHVPETIARIHQQAFSNVQAKAATNPTLMKDKTAFDLALNNEVQALTKEWNKVIDPLDKRNSYNAPPLSVMLDQAEFKQTKLAGVLATQVKAGGLKEADPVVIVNKGLEAFKQGQISLPELASGIRILYSAAAFYNNQANQYARFGIPEQQGYKVKVDMPNVVIGPAGAHRTLFDQEPNAQYDLTNLADVNRFVIKHLAAQSINAFNDNQAQYKSVLSFQPEGAK